MKKVLFVAVAWFIAVFATIVIQSCDDDCGKGEPFYQHLNALQAQPVRISGTEVHNNMAYFTLEPIDSNIRKIRYDSLVIEVAHQFTAFTQPVPGLFDFNKAMACSRVINYSKVSGIEITSNQDFTTWLPKGSNLENIVELHRGKSVNGLKVSFISSNTIPYVEPENWYFTFTHAPQNNVKHDLTIIYKLDNGKEVSATVNNVMITK